MNRSDEDEDEERDDTEDEDTDEDDTEADEEEDPREEEEDVTEDNEEDDVTEDDDISDEDDDSAISVVLLRSCFHGATEYLLSVSCFRVNKLHHVSILIGVWIEFTQHVDRVESHVSVKELSRQI